MKIENGVITFEHLFSSKSVPSDEENPISTLVKVDKFNKSNANGNFSTYNDIEELHSMCKKSAENYNIFK